MRWRDAWIFGVHVAAFLLLDYLFGIKDHSDNLLLAAMCTVLYAVRENRA